MVLLPRRVNCSGKHESKPFDAASWPAAGALADQTAPDVYQVDYALESAVRTADWPAHPQISLRCSTAHVRDTAIAALWLPMRWHPLLVGYPFQRIPKSNAPHSQYAESQIQNELL